MSHLFFIDESGNDRRQMPYEIHGGILVPLANAWSLIRAVKDSQVRLFGTEWRAMENEIKGERLLQRRIFQFAPGRSKKHPDAVPPVLSEVERREAAYSFMKKGYEELLARRAGTPITHPRTAREFLAYGQACLELTDLIFEACTRHEVVVFAAVVERDAPRPPAPQWDELLRKDLVYLYERVFYFMDAQPRGHMAISVFDQKDDLGSSRCVEGHKLNECLARYFTRSHVGRVRSSRILPEPLYARSDLTTLLGMADLAIYLVNHAYRGGVNWTRPVREELLPFLEWLRRLSWRGRKEDGTRLVNIFRVDDLRPKRDQTGA